MRKDLRHTHKKKINKKKKREGRETNKDGVVTKRKRAKKVKNDDSYHQIAYHFSNIITINPVGKRKEEEKGKEGRVRKKENITKDLEETKPREREKRKKNH